MDYQYGYYQEPPAQDPVPPKKKRQGLKVAIAVLCCVALMIGSGLIGAKLVESRTNDLPNASASAQDATPTGSLRDTDSDGKVETNGSSDSSGSSNGSGSNGGNSAEPDTVISGDNSSVEQLGSVNPNGDTLTLTELFAGADPAVVAISTETTGQNAFGRTVTQPAAGSGFIVSSDGYIVTNNHVIEDATSISVLLHNGSKHPAELVGRDPVSDLAVLKIEAQGLSYLTWADSETVQVGEQVAAIGNPLGEFANSLTVGYVSALDREINIDGTPRTMLQTDAAVNAGNSGGPLLNMKGQVLGVVTAKSSGYNVEGLGFAIPSNYARLIVSSIIRVGNTEGYGYVRTQAVIGVMVGTREVDGYVSVYVDSVNIGGAADRAGVKEGDRILTANGTEVHTVSGLKMIINALTPGDELALTIMRGSKEIALTVILDEFRPTEAESHNQYTPDGDYDIPFDPWNMFPGMEDLFPGFEEFFPREG